MRDSKGRNNHGSKGNNELYINDFNCENMMKELDKMTVNMHSMVCDVSTVRTVLYFTLLYFTLLYCTLLYCTILHCTVLYVPLAHVCGIFDGLQCDVIRGGACGNKTLTLISTTHNT